MVLRRRLALTVTAIIAVLALPLAPAPAAELRVVNGGTVASPEAAPWVVRISVGSAFGCSGSLIDSTRVLTAAHCIFGSDGKLTAAGAYTIVAGINSTAGDADTSGRQERKVSSVRAHPRYLRDIIVNDVAVLTLSAPFDVTARVRPIDLVGEGPAPERGSQLRLIGWGETVTGGGSSDKRLHTLDLTQQPGWTCDSGRSSLLCGVPPLNSSTCYGDSGSGIVTPAAAPQLAAVHTGQATAPPCQLNGVSRAVDIASPEIRRWLDAGDTPPIAPSTTGAARARVDGDSMVGQTISCQPPAWESASSIEAEFVDQASGRLLASGRTTYAVQPGDLGRAIACVSIARSAGGVTGAISENALVGVARPPTIGAPASLPAVAAGRPITATATATANDGRSLVRSGWDVTGDRVIDQAGGRLRLVPRTTAPLAISFVAVDDTGASSVASYAPTVAPAPKMTIQLTSSVRRTILRSGIAGLIRRPPSGNVSVTISVGRLQQGRLRAPGARKLRLPTQGDITRRFRLKLGGQLRSALNRRNAVIRVRAVAIGYTLAPAQITSRVRTR